MSDLQANQFTRVLAELLDNPVLIAGQLLGLASLAGTLFDAAVPTSNMHWKLFANLAEAVGQKEVEVAVEPGATFGDAFDALLEAHPELREEVLDEDGNIRDHIRVLRNGDNPFVEDEGHETVLEDGDELALFPPVSGG